ncbi:ABC-type polysaccharide/polyol phosphate transport system ATPase subunit [Desulfohalotomaculum tongense]|uniref:ABC transporter ATP-binding protein n=1 Tax=Desulforadius tongensis TaxID=1216062 RepID=UPI001EE4EEB6|nr:ABC transporter ATP-binding protein [Desulforadius tongensis]MBM7853714.1 ABC-type polysaccharide/polyol phosphate transport system ATPase subunit [Desulforadius tongensis]
MPSDPAIIVNNVSKTYYIYENPITHFFKKNKKKSFNALNNVSLVIEKGKTVGIIGRNGSGKSTLLQIVAGILQPTSGTVEVKGKVAALLELGAGFNLEFTGKENVYLNAAVLGISRKEIEKKYHDIVNFADIGDFINYPVKTYSSGMLVRLAFAVAINMEPEILIIDEALSVGDAAFQHKCFSKLKSLQNKGTTILFVSHDTDAVKSFCQEAVFLEKGTVVYKGDPETAVNKYYQSIHLEQNVKKEKEIKKRLEIVNTADLKCNFETGDRHGSGEAQFVTIDFIDKKGNIVDSIEFGDKITVRLGILFHRTVPHTNIGILWRDSSGVDVLGNDSLNLNNPIPPQEPGSFIYVDFTVENFFLKPGSYALTAAIGEIKPDGTWNTSYYDWVNNAKILHVGVKKNTRVWTKVLLPMEINVYEKSRKKV